MINTITDDRGNKYELRPFFDHETQAHGYILVYIADFQAAGIEECSAFSPAPGTDGEK